MPQKFTRAPCHFCRAWYDSSYTMLDKPMKTLELHYPMIHFYNNKIYTFAVTQTA